MKRALSSYREDENNILVFHFINIKIIVKKNDIKSICNMLDKKSEYLNRNRTSFHFHFPDPNETCRSQEMWIVEFHKISISVSMEGYSVFHLTSSLWVHFFIFSYRDIVYRVWGYEKWILKAHFKTFIRPSPPPPKKAFHQAFLKILQYSFIFLDEDRHGESESKMFFPRTQHTDPTRSRT